MCYVWGIVRPQDSPYSIMGAVPVGTAAGRATEYPMNLLSISHESSFGISPNSFRSDIYRSAYYCKATRLTRYRSPEESISPSAKPSPTPPLDPYSVRTQSTEASPTYVTTPPLYNIGARSYSVSPLNKSSNLVLQLYKKGPQLRAMGNEGRNTINPPT